MRSRSDKIKLDSFSRQFKKHGEALQHYLSARTAIVTLETLQGVKALRADFDEGRANGPVPGGFIATPDWTVADPAFHEEFQDHRTVPSHIQETRGQQDMNCVSPFEAREARAAPPVMFDWPVFARCSTSPSQTFLVVGLDFDFMPMVSTAVPL